MEMALKWVLSSAYKIVVGQPAESARFTKITFPAEGKLVMAQDQMTNHGPGKAQKLLVNNNNGFQMPLHYPRYRNADYEKMEEWKLDMLLREYGLTFNGSLDEKRKFAMGAFLWA